MYIVELKNGNIKTPIHDEKEKLIDGKVVKGINAIDSFSFSLLPSNKGFDRLNELTTLVSVYNTNKNRYEFRGRVLYSASTMDESGLIYKEVVCESYLGFLCDSQQRYVPEQNWTVMGLLQHIINVHNEQVEDHKQFVLGNVTMTDPNDNLYLGIQREDTWKTIEEKLLNKLGGEIAFRVVDEVNYLDYVEKRGSNLTTTIALSKNMKSITREDNPLNYVSRLIPLGAKIKTTDDEGNESESEERVDIKSVNNSLDYIESTEARSAFGIRYATVIFDDITVPSNLLAKGMEYLANNNKVQVKYSVNALDLSLVGLDIDDFDVCNYHPIKNPLLGIDDTARIIKKTIDVCKEVDSTIEFGDNFKTLSDLQIEQDKAMSDVLNRIESTKNELKDYVGKVENGLAQRIEGIDGAYFYIMYSEYDDGHVMTTKPNENTKYMGVCNTNETTAPADHTKYTWSLIRGEKGEAGGSQYLHVKYSDDGETFTANNGEDLGAWIGTLVDFDEDDSMEFSDYTWSKFTEDVDDELDDIRNTIIDQYTTVTNDYENFVAEAVKKYTETSDFEEYKEYVSGQLKLIPEQFSLNFTKRVEELEKVNGVLQSKVNTMTKYFAFNINGLTIGEEGNPYKVIIDNDRYSMTVNGVEVFYVAGGKVYTPEIEIARALNLFGYLIDQDTENRVNCSYVGG